jgi:hypothetical protein
MRRAWKDALLLLLVVVLPAAGLAGCGGGGSSTSSTAAASVPTPASSVPLVPTTATTTTSPAATATKPAAKAPAPHPASPSTSSSASSGSGSSGGAAASFRTQGGDNSIPDYGQEASASERARAAATLAGFLHARASSEWSRVCTYLTRPTRKQLVVFAKASKGRVNGCGPILAALSSGPAASRTDPLIHGVAALRVKGGKAFALFYGPKNSKYVMPMVSEGGAWKMSQFSPVPYPLGASTTSTP